MFDFAFHKLPVAVALAVSLTFGYGVTLVASSLVGGRDVYRTRAWQASAFLVRLHAADGATIWE